MSLSLKWDMPPLSSPLAVCARTHTCIRLLMAADTVAHNQGRERDSEKSIWGVRLVCTHLFICRGALQGTSQIHTDTHTYTHTFVESLIYTVFIEFAYIYTHRAMFINRMNSIITSAELSSSSRSAYRIPAAWFSQVALNSFCVCHFKRLSLFSMT